MSLCYNPSLQRAGIHISACLLISEVQNTTNHVACVADRSGGEGVRKGDEVEESKKRNGVGGEERVSAIRGPIGSILRSLVATKFRLVNQTIAIGGIGRHSMLLLGVVSR